MANSRGNWNIYPVTQTLTSLGSSASHYPTNLYNTSQKAFFNVTSFTATSSHFPTTVSNFQYLTDVYYTLPRSFEEGIMAVDENPVKSYDNYFEEGLQLQDFTFTGTSYQEEDVGFTDEWMVTILPTFEEYVSSVEDVTKTLYAEEEVSILDTFELRIVKYFSEGVGCTDVTQPAYLDGAIYSMQTAILQPDTNSASLTTACEVYDSSVATMNTGIVPRTLAGVTSLTPYPSQNTTTPVVSVSGYGVPIFSSPVSGTSNPFQPTVIINGVTYSSYPSTAPVGAPNSYYIAFDNASIGNIKACEMFNFEMSLDRTGGTFSIATSGNPGYDEGDTIDLFGFNGTVTSVGTIFTNNQVGTITKGIFGNRYLNQQLNILATKNFQSFALLTNSTLARQQQRILGSFEGAAQAIANMAYCNLSWNLPGGGISLVDFTVSEGETALSALSSIASQFGGVLTWDGGVNYVVSAPNFSFGNWVLPDQGLITPSGCQDGTLSDIQTGTYGPGFYYTPISTYFDPRLYGLPDNAQIQAEQTPKIQKINGTSVQIDEKFPEWVLDLPNDTEECYIHVLVKSASGGGGSVSPASQYLTTDPNQWFSIGTPSVAGPVRIENTGGPNGAIVIRAHIDYTYLPLDAPDVSKGYFMLEVGVTKNNQENLFSALLESRDQQIRQLLAKTIGSFRYVKTYEGTINCYFHGSIPVPGMTATATVCGHPITGIIENVSFTYPGILNIQVAQYSLVNFIKNFYNINLSKPDGVN